MSPSKRRFVLAAAALAALPPLSRAADVSPPVILQYFESQWSTIERRMPDVFMAGYGALWTPPPGRALYDDQGGGIGYNLYDRFDLGKKNDRTAYGTEKSYRALINQTHRMNGDVYVDYVHHHVGSWDVPGYNGWGGYTPEPWQHVQDRSDYPGFELSDPYVGANSNDPNYRNFAGHRDSYPDAPPVNDGNTPQFQYQWRLAHLITIDLTSNRAFVRNPVPGDPNNVRQAPAGWAIATSTLLPDGKVGGSTIVRQANSPTDDNKRFYPDTNLPGITVTDPADGNQTFTIHPFNTSDPSAGDPSAETPRGYMMRYAQWLINDVGVDGLRIDAARHVPFGQQPDAYNPQDIDMPSLVDRAVFRQSRRTNLDGSQRTVFSFQEVFTGDKGFIQQFIRKDINPATPNVVGGNRDALDFPMWFAMRANLTSNGFNNNWYNVRNASQDIQDDGLANNGSQAIGFVINHDDGKGHVGSSTDYIHLDNVAHAWILTRPGNAYVYFNSHEFDRTGNTQFFLKDGRGDALGGQYGNIVTRLLDVRNSYGRGNFQERWIDGGGFSNIYAYERQGSMIVGLNSALGTVTNYDQRTMGSAFPAGTRLEEQTGNALDPQVDPNGEIPDVITVGAGGSVTMRIPRNQTTSGVQHGRGYVIYGLPRPTGDVALSNVAQTLGNELPGNNATARITAVDVITANSFNVTLTTNKRILSDAFHDHHADGDRAYLRIDGGLDLNGSGGVDFINGSETRYGFENFVTLNDPGFDPNPANSGNGQYVQSINAANLSEGYHYLTARAYRHTSFAGEQDVFSDFKKVFYVDRLPPVSVIDAISSISGTGQSRRVEVRSLDQTAEKVDVFMNLGAALTDAQIIALASSGTLAQQSDRDLFQKDFTNLATGTHVITTLTREISGNYSIIRATGYPVFGGQGIGFGDMDASGAISAADVNSFRSVLESNNQVFSAQAEANTDGLVNLADAFLLGPRLAQVNADAAATSNYNAMINAPFVTTGTYTVNANYNVHDVTAGTTNVTTGNTLTARTIRGGALNLSTGAQVTIQPQAAGGSTSAVNTLSIASGAKLDLADNAIVVHTTPTGSWNGSSYTGLIGAVQSGYNGGDWAGSGIVTSITSAISPNVLTALAIAAASDTPFAGGMLNGVSVNPSDTVIRFTYGGDANLDGELNGDDYFQIDSNINLAGSVFGYTNGDFNYDGDLNGDDYFIIDSNINIGQNNPMGSMPALAPVPEPAALGVVSLAGCAFAARRRRHRASSVSR